MLDSREQFLHSGRNDDLPIIDAHHHVWDLERNHHPWLCDPEPIPFRYGDYSSIRHTFMPDDFRALWGRHKVVGTVYMEAEWDPSDPIGETRWVHEVHARWNLPNAMVGQVWLERDDAAEVIRRQAEFPLVRSLRQKPRGFAGAAEYRPGHQLPGSMRCPRWLGGFEALARSGLHYDLQTPWWHLGDAFELAGRFPETLIIINHTGLPADRSDDGLARWRDALAVIAEAPNARLKISGIGVPGRRWTTALNGDVVRSAIRTFGVDRCMFASNFPVDGVCASFDEIFTSFKAITADLSRPDRLKLFHDNAVGVYRPILN